MDDFETLQQILPLLIPVFIIQLLLIIVALRDLLGRERVRGPRWLWFVVIVLVNILGPILYFLVGREEQ